jgi:hypothetical protein
MHQLGCQQMPNRILRIGFWPKNFWNNPKARKSKRFTNRTRKDMSMRLIFAILGASAANTSHAKSLAASSGKSRKCAAWQACENLHLGRLESLELVSGRISD